MVTEVAISDVEVTLSDSRDPEQIGTALTYTATVHNIGDDDARDVVLTLVVPRHVLFSRPPGCIRVLRCLTCALGTLGNGASMSITIVTHPLTSGFKYATASVTLSTPDPNPANNSATARTWVNP